MVLYERGTVFPYLGCGNFFSRNGEYMLLTKDFCDILKLHM